MKEAVVESILRFVCCHWENRNQTALDGGSLEMDRSGFDFVRGFHGESDFRFLKTSLC